MGIIFNLFYMHSSPYLCVWRWSDDLLSGSRCFDRWARRRLRLESGIMLWAFEDLNFW